MANEENLIPFNERTESEQREIATQGGIASGESRRKRKAIKECLEILLEKPITDKNGNTMSGVEAISSKVFNQALKGNMRAIEFVQASIGEKPIDKVAVASVDAETMAEVEQMVKDAERT